METNEFYIKQITNDLAYYSWNADLLEDMLNKRFIVYIGERCQNILRELKYHYNAFSLNPFVQTLIENGVSKENIVHTTRRKCEIHLNKNLYLINTYLGEKYGKMATVSFWDNLLYFDINNYHSDEIAIAILKIDSEFDKWISEFEALKIEASKIYKEQVILIMSINTLIQSKLAGTGIEYVLEHLEDKSVLTVKARNRQISMDISHKKFVEACKDIRTTVLSMLEHLKKIPSKVKIQNARKLNWKKAE